MGLQVDSIPFNATEVAGTLTNNTATLAANKDRRGAIFSNNSDTVMTLAIGSTATASVGIAIPAGTAISFRDGYVPVAALSLFCAGSSKAYTYYHW